MPNSKTVQAHTPGAIRAAEIIIREGVDSRGHPSRIQTAYGPKTREGIADLIDNETHAPELLAALQDLLGAYEKGVANHAGVKEAARLAISKAEGRT